MRMKTSISAGGLIFAALFAAASGGSAVAASKVQIQPEDGWVTYKDSAFGYSFYYPSTFFEPQGIAGVNEAKTFLSPDKRAKVVVTAVENDEDFSLAGYRTTILEEVGGYDMLDYSPKGQSWFVLSGNRGETIYYQKVLFSCGNRVINVLSVTFPSADKAFYEGIVEVMEDNFRPGRGTDAPSYCPN